ncbi:MAG: T9SS C-terminal target domain-containing protein [Bacteroidetes bacterium]|nr:MAG: T9SS C-terminal target domain-containing protein [Bacteroidota bacterium]
MKNKKLLLALALILAGVFNLAAQNYGLHFNGQNNKVGVLDSPELNPSTALTLEVWINAQSWAGSIWGACLISKQGTNPDKGYGLTVGENGRIEFNHSVNQSWSAAQTPPILGLNSWYHIAAVYDLNTMKIYVNGVLQASATAQGTPTPGNGVTMNLGDNPTWPGRFFHGVMDEIRIWDVARTQEEIQDYMNTELSGTEPGLVAYWNMNEGTGNTISDATENENDGTLLNMSEENWVAGFVPPSADLGVLGIASPSSIGTGFSAQEYIMLDVKNFATDPVEQFSMGYKINDQEPVTESFQLQISAFAEQVIAFSDPVDLSGFNEITIKAWVSLEGDANPINDTIVVTLSPSTSIMLYDLVQHNFGSAGQTHFNTLYMPQDLSGYKTILLNLDLYCPSGGCDPWDQPGMLYIQKDNVAYEIVRYITPYGRACGGWTFDLTDFKPIMTGKTIFESIIRVWGASGWLVDMEIILEPGTAEYEPIMVNRLWNEDYWVYGDPDISYIFPQQTVTILEDTEKASMRMTVTGHGQGNTLNAAEFSEFTHHIWVNGEQTFDMHLWNDDCDQNPCSPQSGTWQFSRAGWCPGQDVQQWFYNLDEHITAGETIDLDFVLADYTNHNNTGYNNTSHTEPHYRAHAYLIQYKKNQGTNVENVEGAALEDLVKVFPNPTKGTISISADNAGIQNIGVYSMDGRLVKSIVISDSHFVSVDISEMPVGLYIVQVQTSRGVASHRVVKQ